MDHPSFCGADPASSSCDGIDPAAGPTSIVDLFAQAAATVSALGIAVVLLMQMDFASRRLLSPTRLLA
jgi:hypothetical protein